ncbi:MAG TPA: flagellar biosynthesis anti-sigma factor FlgM [Rheinheimera sp.]|uniref:flagellar biosynthesis anti-sigma factor FlgM n=1 Tax=Rheinheimera sp. TaxID=1869214 RepID=UPI000EEC5EE4|nr:flagellar biosynthesis anti-sigma factor FlgM [Rheinheimera sp.]HCU66580.1 flagellar biosynthesis anti-sigma factor FlgM [Rheinheimera sp.]
MAINVNQGVQNATTVKTDKVDQSIQKQQVAQQQVNMSAPSQKQDSVSLTTQAQQFTKAQEKASNSSGIDQEKVDKIKQAIAEGKYKINVEALARRIMQFEGELFDKK